MPHHYSNNKAHNKKDAHYSSIAHWRAPWNASYRAIYLMCFPTALSIDSHLKPPTGYSCKNMQFFLSILEFARKHVHLPSRSSIFLKKIGCWPFRKTAIKDKYVCKLRMYIILCVHTSSPINGFIFVVVMLGCNFKNVRLIIFKPRSSSTK